MDAARVGLICVFAVAISAQPSFFREAEIDVLGGIAYGETSAKLDYTNRPRYIALHFDGRAGDTVDIKIDSINGQAMAALTDSRYKPIVSNFGSHIVTTLPAGPEPYPNRYFIVIQEERRNPATFQVTLNKVAAGATGAGYLTCSADSDCVAVPREGCCRNGYKDAVNKDRIAEYRRANACKFANPMCPQFIVNDTRVARCNSASHQCEMTVVETSPR